MYQTFAHQINRAKTILDGLKTNGETMTKYGITAEFVTGLTALLESANRLEKQRNDLKTSAQANTVEQTEIMAQLNKQCSTVKRTVKTWMPKEQWHAFGFRAGEYAGNMQPASSETLKA
jgi:NurA-like 5'-3' nuclease